VVVAPPPLPELEPELELELLLPESLPPLEDCVTWPELTWVPDWPPRLMLR